MRCGVRTIVSGALMCATLAVGSLGASSQARADVIAPHEVPMRVVGIRRPRHSDNPRWRCLEEAEAAIRKNTPKGQAQIGSADPTQRAEYKACMDRNVEAVKAFEAEQARYNMLSTAFAIIVFGLLPLGFVVGLIMFWRRRKSRISRMEDAELPTPEGDDDGAQV